MSSGYKGGSIKRTCSPGFWNMAVMFGIPQGRSLQEEIENVQNTAARFVTSDYYFETGGMTAVLEKL